MIIDKFKKEHKRELLKKQIDLEIKNLLINSI